MLAMALLAALPLPNFCERFSMPQWVKMCPCTWDEPRTEVWFLKKTKKKKKKKKTKVRNCIHVDNCGLLEVAGRVKNEREICPSLQTTFPSLHSVVQS
jgi:hypothetical protein